MRASTFLRNVQGLRALSNNGGPRRWTGPLCFVLLALVSACVPLFWAQSAKAQVFSGDQLYIAPDELLYIEEPFRLNPPLFSTVNRGQLILTKELIHVSGVIQQGSEALTGSWRQQMAPFEPAPNDHVIFEQGADWNNTGAGFIDGAVRKFGAEDFVFPTADIAAGTLFSGKVAIQDKISVAPVDARDGRRPRLHHRVVRGLGRDDENDSTAAPTARRRQQE